MKTITELFDFKGKVIIISGAAGAIGSAASRFLSSLGANVVLSDLNEEKVMKLASDIQSETGYETLGMKTDFTEEAQIESLIKATVEKFGKISGVVNNVGWGANTPLWGSDSQKMVDAYKLNTLGAYNLTRFSMPYLKKKKMPPLYFRVQWLGTLLPQNL